jgi:hypothetical protein
MALRVQIWEDGVQLPDQTVPAAGPLSNVLRDLFEDDPATLTIAKENAAAGEPTNTQGWLAHTVKAGERYKITNPEGSVLVLQFA